MPDVQLLTLVQMGIKLPQSSSMQDVKLVN